MKENEQQRRDFILNNNLWVVVLAIAGPIALYNGFNFIYGLIDTLLVANISTTAVSAVAFFDQIKNAISTLGTGLAAGGSIIVARYLGAKEENKAKSAANTLVCIALIFSVAIIVLIVPFAQPLLRLANAPEELISIGVKYFVLQIITLSLVFFNNVFIGLQKAKGSSKSILYYNLIVMGVKVSLSSFFIFVLQSKSVEMMALSTLLAQSILTLIGIFHFASQKYIFHFSYKRLDLRKKTLFAIFGLSLPIFLGKFVFSFGKVIVNSIGAGYGKEVVGALGVSNQISSCFTNITTSFEESSAAIISQNIGNKNIKRGLQSFQITAVIVAIIGLFGTIVLSFLSPVMAEWYDNKQVVYTKSEDNYTVQLTFDYDEYLLKLDVPLVDNVNDFFNDSLIGMHLDELKIYINSITPVTGNEIVVMTLFLQALDSVIVDYNFAGLIMKVFNLEKLSITFFALASAVMGLLYGFGYTKLTFVINLGRLFIFRIPTLLIFKWLVGMPDDPSERMQIGATAVGAAMSISNFLIGLIALLIGVIVFKRIKTKGYKDHILSE